MSGCDINTQTHILLAAAVLIPAAGSAAVFTRTWPIAKASPATVSHGAVFDGTANPVAGNHAPGWLYAFAVLFGAVIPDLSLFVMWGWAKSQGIAESRIWSELYYSDYWQQLGAISNSAPLMLVLLALAWVAGLHANKVRSASIQAASASLSGLAAAALLHIACDFPLHHDDGHPHFWPLSDWIFSSPVSYWDPSHLSRYWVPLELMLALLCATVLWRRFAGRPGVRLLLLLGLASYVVVAGYWYNAFS